MASAFVYHTSDGGGSDGGGERAQVMHDWIRAQGNASLIVYGGDVYQTGLKKNFAKFLEQIGGDPKLYCETPGNHDWINMDGEYGPNTIPVGYENFWAQFPPPQSKQPILTGKRAGARYEHFIDINGWRMVLLDTGALEHEPWPMGNEDRRTWLNAVLRETPGRGKIVIAHHSRLQWGRHRDAPGLDGMWKALFDDDGTPRAAFTIGGHNHNVSVYSFRDRDLKKTDATRGIQLWVNGAGGVGSDDRDHGTPADLYPRSKNHADDPRLYAVTRIEVHDATRATAQLLSFGAKPAAGHEPKVIFTQEFQS
jgi:hypothetical protein